MKQSEVYLRIIFLALIFIFSTIAFFPYFGVNFSKVYFFLYFLGIIYVFLLGSIQNFLINKLMMNTNKKYEKIIAFVFYNMILLIFFGIFVVYFNRNNMIITIYTGFSFIFFPVYSVYNYCKYKKKSWQKLYDNDPLYKKIELTSGKFFVFRHPQSFDAMDLVDFLRLMKKKSEYKLPVGMNFDLSFENSVNPDKTEILLGEINGEIVCVSQMFNVYIDDIGDSWELIFFIKEKYWGKGIATDFFDYLLDYGHTKGEIKLILMRLHVNDTEHLYFFRKFGFCEVSLKNNSPFKKYMESDTRLLVLNLVNFQKQE